MELRTCNCPSCGAPAHVGAPGAVEVCRFCGAEIRADLPDVVSTTAPSSEGPARTPAEEGPPLDVPRPTRTRPDVNGIVGACIAVAVIVGGTLAVAWHRLGSHTSEALMLAQLARANLDENWHSLTGASRMAGGYESVDPVANLAWAQSIAVAWRSDASPFAIQASCVSEDGTTDLTGSRACVPWIEYWFASRACLAGSTAECDDLAVQAVAADGRAGSAPGIRVAGVRLTRAGSIQQPVCPLARALAAIDGGVRASAPSYQVHLDEGKWTIYRTGRGKLGVVDATTCAVLSR